MTRRIIAFYLDGFRNMRLGRTLWAIILFKLIIMFGVLRFYFFPDYLNSNFTTDQEKASHVLENISRLPNPSLQQGGDHVRTN